MSLRGAGRFAPTPTGRLHLGNARTALLSWLWARGAGVPNVLRVEDLDAAAVPRGAISGLFEDLDWLGLTYDEEPRRGGPCGPYQQSARLERYLPALSQLNALGLLYPCGCSRKDVAQAALAPHSPLDGALADDGPAYPGTCRPETPRPLPDLGRTMMPNGRPAALRLNVPAALAKLGVHSIVFEDAVCGRVESDLGGARGDFVIRRSDGLTAYQLACAWDDVEMGCTQVLRGMDLLTSALRQVLLLRLLGLEEPRYAHVGLVLAADGQKLSKRDASISLADLRLRGVPPGTVLAQLADLSGLTATDDLAVLAADFAPGPALRESVRLPGITP